MRRRHRIRHSLILGGIVGVILLSGVLFFPASVTRVIETREVMIPRGAGVETIAGILKANGLVKSPTLFVLAARVLGYDRNLKAGRFTIPVGSSIYRILRQLASGMGKQDMVTIPEGLRADEIAATLFSQSKIDPVRFLSLATDSTFSRSLGVPAGRLEGYLFPDTYPFYPLLTPEEVIRVMVAHARSVFEEEMALPDARTGLNLHELVTLASIVEAEAEMPSERPRIAAVFYNRLRRSMMLQSDPTVSYSLGIYRDRVYYRDLNVKSPYNTYRVKGLPPGPICNPGRGAFHAVLFPLADTTEFYFVARGDGTHIFSKTWQEHVSAIAHVRAMAKVESTAAPVEPLPERGVPVLHTGPVSGGAPVLRSAGPPAPKTQIRAIGPPAPPKLRATGVPAPPKSRPTKARRDSTK